MANPEHVAILKQGVEVWNEWRMANQEVRPDLSEASLRGTNLSEADLSGANLSGANLSEANLSEANLVKAKLSKANLFEADLFEADLSKADLRANLFGAKLTLADLSGANLFGAKLTFADLSGADLSEADLSGADLTKGDLTNATLSGAHLERATLVGTILTGASLSECRVYGVSAWGLDLTEVKDQSNLVITPKGESTITVDNLEVAQFVYLLLHNEKIRGVIDTIGKKGVLILGRFTPERKAVLDAIRTRLRELGYVPMLFDFDKPTQRDFSETVRILAGMSRFIIADITNPKSSPLELQATVPDYMVPFVPIQHEDEEPFSMFADLHAKYDWVLDVLKYDSADNLIKLLEPAVVKPALAKADELLIRKAEARRERHISEYK